MDSEQFNDCQKRWQNARVVRITPVGATLVVRQSPLGFPLTYITPDWLGR